MRCVLRGEESSWNQIPFIKNLLKIEIKLDELLQDLRHQIFTQPKEITHVVHPYRSKHQISYSNPNLMFYASQK